MLEIHVLLLQYCMQDHKAYKSLLVDKSLVEQKGEVSPG